jgi:hypothetical protein
MSRVVKRLIVGAGFLACLLSGAAWGRAQVLDTQPAGHVVLSGSDLGFRIEGVRGGKPVGRLVVRQNGQWVEVEPALVVRPMGLK